LESYLLHNTLLLISPHKYSNNLKMAGEVEDAAFVRAEALIQQQLQCKNVEPAQMVQAIVDAAYTLAKQKYYFNMWGIIDCTHIKQLVCQTARAFSDKNSAFWVACIIRHLNEQIGFTTLMESIRKYAIERRDLDLVTELVIQEVSSRLDNKNAPGDAATTTAAAELIVAVAYEVATSFSCHNNTAFGQGDMYYGTSSFLRNGSVMAIMRTKQGLKFLFDATVRAARRLHPCPRLEPCTRVYGAPHVSSTTTTADTKAAQLRGFNTLLWMYLDFAPNMPSVFNLAAAALRAALEHDRVDAMFSVWLWVPLQLPRSIIPVSPEKLSDEGER
jgi:hypothetical protein